MKQHLKGVAKCLIFSLAAAALTGCAVYEPYPGGYGYGYDPYYPYGQPVYSGPYYVGPPISLGLWFEGRSGGGNRWGGHHGGWGGGRR